MGIFARAVQRERYGTGSGYFWPHEYNAGLTNLPDDMDSDSAMAMLAVYASVKLISEDVARLPFIVYKRLPKGKERDTEHPTYKLLHDSPNPEMTAMSFREALTGQTVLRGNGFANVERDGALRPIRLWPLRSDRMTARHRESDGALEYKYTLPSGEPVILQRRDVFHLRGFSGNGLWGYSPIAQARAELRSIANSRDWNSQFYRNGANPGGVLMHPGPEPLSTNARKNMEDSWNTAHQGITNAHRIAILEEGVTYSSVGISPEDAQWIETQHYNTEQIARLFRLAPHKLSDFQRATFSNIEETNIDHVVSTLDSWFVRWEQQSNMDLLPSDHFAEHLRDALMRGTLLNRYRAYAISINWGFKSPNEVREAENLNPIPDVDGESPGDVFLSPINMQNQDKLLEEEPAQPEPGQEQLGALGAEFQSINTQQALARQGIGGNGNGRAPTLAKR